jgi:AcrR family transcriptional regulator
MFKKPRTPRRTARPRIARPQRPTSKAGETRDRILAAALRLFKKKGFAETTMRDIAQEAGVATGAAYYYFDSKDKLVAAFYEEVHRRVQARGEKPLLEERDLRARLGALVTIHIEEFEPHRRFVGELFRVAADPESPLSPFGEETRQIREETIRRFAIAIEESSAKIPADLREALPRLIWLYQMGVILFWIHDRSAGQARTAILVDRTLDLVVTLLRIARFPLLAPVRKAAVELLSLIEAAGPGLPTPAREES